MLDFEFRRVDKTLIFDSNTRLDDLTIQLKKLSSSRLNVLNSLDTTYVEFIKSFSVENTLIIYDYVNTKLDNQLIDILNSNCINLIYSDNYIVKTNIVELSVDEGNLYVKIDANLTKENTLELPKLVEFCSVGYSNAFITNFLPIVSWDKTNITPSESNIYDFDSIQYALDRNLNALNGEGDVGDIGDFSDGMIKQYITDFEIDEMYVDVIDENGTTYSDSPYDRLKEYDLTGLSSTNKLTNEALKWCHAFGLNSIGTSYIMNTNPSYGENSALASHSNDYDSYSTLDKSWFIIGTPAFDYNKNNWVSMKSYANKILTSDDFKSTTIDAYDEYLTHKFNEVNDTYVDNYSYSIVRQFNQDDEVGKSNVLFRGVEYIVDAKYSGYKFSVVLILSPSKEPYIEMVANDTFRSLTLLIHYAIGDVYSTKLNANNNDNYKLDRVSLYEANEFDTDINSTITSDIDLNISYPKKVSSKIYAGVLYDSDIIYVSDELLYAVEIKNLPSYIAINNFIAVGDNISFISKNSQGVDVNHVQLNDVVYVGANYVWCTNITISNVSFNDVIFTTSDYNDINDVDTIIQELSNISINEYIYTNEYSVNADTTINRFDVLRLFNQIENINNSSIDINVSDKESYDNLKRLFTYDNDYSYTLSEDIDPDWLSMSLLRYSTPSVPLVQYIIQPSNYTYNNNIYKNTNIYNNVYDIDEYVINKIGDENTLNVDSVDNQTPNHLILGESVLDRITLPIKNTLDGGDGYRIYYDKNAYNTINSSRIITHYSSILSTLLRVNNISYSFSLNVVDGNFSFNIYTKLIEMFRAQSSFSNITSLELSIMVDTILDTYKYESLITNPNNGFIFPSEIQDVVEYNAQTTNNQYQISGYINTNLSQVNAKISII